MKKFISMVMAAAMVVSLVPATAFAAESTLKVVDSKEWTKNVADQKKADKEALEIAGPQLQLKVRDVDTTFDVVDTFEIKLHFDNAEIAEDPAGNAFAVKVYDKDTNKTYPAVAEYDYDEEDTSVEITFKEPVYEVAGETKATEVVDIDEEDIVYIGITGSDLIMSSYRGEATVEVTGDLGGTDAKVIAAVLEEGIDVDLEDDIVDVAEEEIVKIEDLVIEPTVGDTFADVCKAGDELTLKVSKGFEFVESKSDLVFTAKNGSSISPSVEWDEDELNIVVGTGILNADEITISGLAIEAVSAKAGDVATITVDLADNDKVSVEVAKVVEPGLSISVDEDEDVPVIYSGVNVANYGITDDSKHESLEITIEESVAASFDETDVVELTLPEGVYVVGADDGKNDDFGMLEKLAKAYEEGDHEEFKFKRRTLKESKPEQDAFETNLTFTLIAEPGFVGKVEMGLVVDGDEIGSVVIAEFVSPVIIEAAQNDLVIDYRNTKVPTNIVVKEAEDGLWEKDEFDVTFVVDHMQFEDDPVFTVNEESDMEIDADGMTFVVDERSDDEAAVITISDIELYMERNIPAGAYDLEMSSTAAAKFYTTDKLFTTEKADCGAFYVADVKDYKHVDNDFAHKLETAVVKEGFINVITSGRDKDDASFTTKVVVPVGENVMYANDQQVTLDVPAYINANGYTMLPVRAVAVALGIDTNNVLWNQPTKTVTILYGQRIITMTAGQKVVNVNGSALPATAAVEIVNGRTFLGMRDLATALGVTDITWDAATQTATLNGNK